MFQYGFRLTQKSFRIFIESLWCGQFIGHLPVVYCRHIQTEHVCGANPGSKWRYSKLRESGYRFVSINLAHPLPKQPALRSLPPILIHRVTNRGRRLPVKGVDRACPSLTLIFFSPRRNYKSDLSNQNVYYIFQSKKLRFPI